MQSTSLLESELSNIEALNPQFFAEVELLGQYWHSINSAEKKIGTMFTERQLNYDRFFERCKNIPNTLEAKSAFLFEEILSQPYTQLSLEHLKSTHGIARPLHGISHIVRASIYLVALVNLIRYAGSKIGDEIKNQDDINMLSDIIMMHDIARTTEGKDIDELNSAMIAFFYFKERGYTIAQAKLMAEAIANKGLADTAEARGGEKKVYFSLTITDEDISWAEHTILEDIKSFNILIFILNIADCADIIRARNKFEVKYFQFYELIVKDENDNENIKLLHYMGKLLQEIKCLVFDQGAFSYLRNREILSQYEDINCYQKTLELIGTERYPLLKKIYNKGQLFSEKDCAQTLIPELNFKLLQEHAERLFPDLSKHEKTQEGLLLSVLSCYEKLISQNLPIANDVKILIGQLIRWHINTNDYPVFLRGIAGVNKYAQQKSSARNLLAYHDPNNNNSNVDKTPPTQAELEIKKISRNWFNKNFADKNQNKNHQRDWIQTSLAIRKKLGDSEKIGNPKRSCVAWLPGIQQFTTACYAIISPDWKQVGLIAPVNKLTGKGKKKDTAVPDMELSKPDKIKKFQDLRENLWKGGELYKGQTIYSHTNEIMYQITDYNMVVFTIDPCPANAGVAPDKSYFTPHLLIPELEAIFLQYAYENVHARKLPLVYRSGMADQHEFIGYFTEQEILQKWETIINDFLAEKFKVEPSKLSLHLNADDILKAISTWSFNDLDKFSSLISNYPYHLQQQVKLIIQELIQKFIKNLIIKIKELNQLQIQERQTNDDQLFEYNINYLLLNIDFSLLNNDERFEIILYLNNQLNALHSDGQIEKLMIIENSKVQKYESLFYKLPLLEELNIDKQAVLSGELNVFLENKIFVLSMLIKRLNILKSQGNYFSFLCLIYQELQQDFSRIFEKEYIDAEFDDEKLEQLCGRFVFMVYYCYAFNFIKDEQIHTQLKNNLGLIIKFWIDPLNKFSAFTDDFPVKFLLRALELGLLAEDTQKYCLDQLEILENVYKNKILPFEPIANLINLLFKFQKNIRYYKTNYQLNDFIGSLFNKANINDFLEHFLPTSLDKEFLRDGFNIEKIIDVIFDSVISKWSKYSDMQNSNFTEIELSESAKQELSNKLFKFKQGLPADISPYIFRMAIGKCIRFYRLSHQIDDILLSNYSSGFFAQQTEGSTVDIVQGDVTSPKPSST